MAILTSPPPKSKQPHWTQRRLTSELVRSAIRSAQYAKHEAKGYEEHQSAQSAEIILTRVVTVYGELIDAVADGRAAEAERLVKRLVATRGQEAA